MLKRFRTRPVEIDAMQFLSTLESYQELVDWTEGNFRYAVEEAVPVELFPSFLMSGPDTIIFEVYDKLHDTWIKVSRGQWIVRGAKGEFYPCDDETFHWKYEEVKETLV